MRFLFLGDLVGKPARKAVAKFLAKNKRKLKIDIVIANSDNLAHGKGITRKTLEEMLGSGVDVLTCGDHAWDNTQVFDVLKEGDLNFLCPANSPKFEAKNGARLFNIGGYEFMVVNLLGKVFITREADSPFEAVDKIFEEMGKARITIVDFHAEATSEKLAMAEYLNGKVTAVLGTHTHVQTADEEILSGGTAYISDAGMVGVKDSILGSEKKSVLEHFLSDVPFKYKLAESEEVLLSGVILDVDEKTGKAKKIQRFREVVLAPN